MRRGARAGLAAGLALFAGLGCDLFPPELYQTDARPPVPDAGERVPLADRCADAPALAASVTNARIDLGDLADDLRDPGCTGTVTAGADGFFTVAMEAGEKWHFHLSPAAGLGFDPALYVLRSCDTGSCDPGHGIDICGADQDEHLTFVAPEAGSYVVAVDGAVAGGGIYDLLVEAPVCGSGGGPEHSESCDDGNLVAGDGCDALCRAELSAERPREVEPNDDRTGANVLPLPFDAQGRAGGRCDVDTFVFEHPGGPIQAALLADQDGVGAPCVDPPALSLELLDAEGTVLQTGTAAAGECPALSMDAAPGSLYLRVTAPADAESFPYVLALR